MASVSEEPEAKAGVVAAMLGQHLEPGQPTTFNRPEILSVQHLFNLVHKFGGLNRVEHGVAVWIDRPEDAVGCGQEAIEVACGIEGSTGGIFEAPYYLTSICPEVRPTSAPTQNACSTRDRAAVRASRRLSCRRVDACCCTLAQSGRPH